MTPAEANRLVDEVVEQKRRWGKNLSPRDFNLHDLLDALVLLRESKDDDAQKELTRAKQQLGASMAREAKRKAERDAAIEEVKRLNACLQYLADAWPGDLSDNGLTLPDGTFIERSK